MLAIGRGLMARPKMLMFDEPSLGLAPILVQEIFRIVEMINKQGVTILLVEQNVKHTLAMCDRAYVLENGRIIMSGAGKELLNDQHVKEAYLGMRAHRNLISIRRSENAGLRCVRRGRFVCWSSISLPDESPPRAKTHTGCFPGGDIERESRAGSLRYGSQDWTSPESTAVIFHSVF